MYCVNATFEAIKKTHNIPYKIHKSYPWVLNKKLLWLFVAKKLRLIICADPSHGTFRW